MRNTRLLSGITAFIITASVTSVRAGFNVGTDFKEIVSYLQNDYDGELKSYDFDVNLDNKVNILDMIYAKSAAEGETDINAEKISVEYLNSVAKILSSVAGAAGQRMEIAGKIITKTTYSSDELEKSEKLSETEREFAEYINEEAEFYGISRWLVVMNPDNLDVICCITGDNILQRTGAYPGMIPRTLNIPFSSDLAEFAAVSYYDWNTEFGKYKAANPSQSELSDFSTAACLSERSRISRDLFTELQCRAQEYEATGRELPEGIISSDDSSDYVRELVRSIPEYGRFRWQAKIHNCEVLGVTAENPLDGFCGSYPKTVPERLNIPYSEKLIDFAADRSRDWMSSYSDYLTSDKEQLRCAEIFEKSSTPELNAYAKNVYTNAQTVLQEYETRGIIISFDKDSDVIDANHRFNEELMELLPQEMKNKGIRWEITAENYVVTGAAVYCEDAVGTFPNAVPSDMRIPYSEDIIKYASGDAGIWKEKFSTHTLETADQGYPYSPDAMRRIKNAAVNSGNVNAKSVFANAQTVLQETLTKGEELLSGMVTSEDDTDFVKKVDEYLHISSESKWAVYISDDTVTGAVYSNNIAADSGVQYFDAEKDKFVYSPSPFAGKSFTGSYPSYVPSDMEISYDHSLVLRYNDKSVKW